MTELPTISQREVFTDEMGHPVCIDSAIHPISTFRSKSGANSPSPVSSKAWYDGCEFHCPADECGELFADKDLLNRGAIQKTF